MSNKYLNEKYLGDGLYADFDGYQFILKTLREDGIHFICLDQMVFANFIRYTHEVNQKIQSQLNINIGNAIDNG